MAEKLIEGREYVVFLAEKERPGGGEEADSGGKTIGQEASGGKAGSESEKPEKKRWFCRQILQTVKKYFKLLIKQSFSIPKTGREAFALASNWLVALSLIGVVFYFLPLWWAEVRFETKEKVRQGTFGELLRKNVTHTLVEVPDPYFSIVIPRIEARAKILPNIDASSQREYTAALRQGVAHAKGTVFPGMDGTIYLFAHSAQAPWDIRRYNAVFYLLRELEAGDQIIVFFQGIRYDYAVTKKKVALTTETGFFGQRGEEVLVLQTCHPPGTTREALLVWAKMER